MEDPRPAGEAIAQAGTLADQVTETLMDKIRSGEFAVGDQLPSEAALTQRFGVSRTVVREAVSRLKAAGLVTTRQGKGTVVVGFAQPAHFQIDVDEDAVKAVLHVMELRSGLDAEVAALAAERRTAQQTAAIQRALDAIEDAVTAGRDGVDEDLAFHNAIADATGNPLYTSLLGFLRQCLREAVTLGRMSEPRFGDIRAQLQQEHRAVANAIANRDVQGARAAARHHVANVGARIGGADIRLWSDVSREVARRLAKSEEIVRKHVREEER